jgi:hypothetical protein
MIENLSLAAVFTSILILLLTVYLFFSKIIKLEQEINDLKYNFGFHQNFFIEYEKEKNKTFKENDKKNKFRTYYSLLLFSSKIKNFIGFVRIVIFRKIANILLIIIIEKNKKYLKKTSAKFIDMLKPKNNQKKFSIIYCYENMVNGVEKHKMNIIIDFLMYIHDYASTKIHLNNIEEKDIIQNIQKKDEGNSSDETYTYHKTDISSVPTNELTDYIFDTYNIENEIKKEINKIEKEELNLIENENENEESFKNDIIEYDYIISNKNEENDENEEKEITYEDNTKNKINLKDNIKKRKDNKENEKEFVINKEAKDNLNIKNEKESEIEKLNLNLKKKFILKDEYIEEKDLKLVEKILLKNNKIISINELIKLYNDNLDDKNKLNNISNMYKNKINNYKCDISKEFTIEEILENYKLQFDENFALYKNKNIKKHYRFDTFYRKIIKVEEVRNINLNIMKEDIKKLSGNDLIDIISEDKGNFGNDLEIEDF